MQFRRGRRVCKEEEQMNAYELADLLGNIDLISGYEVVAKAQTMLRQQADHIAELQNQLDKCSHHEAMAHQGGYEIGRASQIKELSDEENNLKWWISSFEHLKALGGGISDEMETKLKEMKAKLKKASEK